MVVKNTETRVFYSILLHHIFVSTKFKNENYEIKRFMPNIR